MKRLAKIRDIRGIKRSIISSVFFLLPLPLLAGAPIFPFLHTIGPSYGPPQKGEAYNLLTTIPIQKIKGGYLIIENPELTQYADPDEPKPAILLTSKEYQENQALTGIACYVGQQTYTTTTGFEATAYVFREIPKQSEKWAVQKETFTINGVQAEGYEVTPPAHVFHAGVQDCPEDQK